MQRRSLSMITLLGAMSLAGCVTINIYFPAAAAERAADRIIDEIYQLTPDASKPPADKAAPKPPADKPAAPK